jgi:membrane-associated protease RseP (regulator of RpoE activity)
VAVAGSTMHFILALGLIFVALTAIGQPSGTLDPETQAADWRIGQVIEGSGAEAAGLAGGDRIVTIDGEPITTFDDLRAVTGERRGETVPVTYERDGERLTTDVGLQPYYSWYVDRVVPDTGPAAAGLEVGDQLVEIDGTSTREVEDLGAFLAAREGDTVPVVVARLDGDQALQAETEVTVESLIVAGTEGYIGVSRERGPEERLGPIEALVRTPAEFVNVTALSLEALGNFFTPSGISDFAGQVGSAREDRALATATPDSDDTSATLVEGGAGAPAGENRLLSIFGLVRLGADAGEVDPAGLIVLFALINIFIGVFNLVPLLPFDGGHVVIAVYEKIQERRLDRRRYFTDVSRLMPLTYVVVIGLAMLFFSTLYLDIANPLEIR